MVNREKREWKMTCYTHSFPSLATNFSLTFFHSLESIWCVRGSWPVVSPKKSLSCCCAFSFFVGDMLSCSLRGQRITAISRWTNCLSDRMASTRWSRPNGRELIDSHVSHLVRHICSFFRSFFCRWKSLIPHMNPTKTTLTPANAHRRMVVIHLDSVDVDQHHQHVR